MKFENNTLQASGGLGASQAIGTNITMINNPGPGRWKLWGAVRHSLADGVRVRLAATTLVTVPNTTNTTENFGPLYIEVLNSTDDFILDLAVATGAADNAAGMIIAQKIS